jgi:hypothetical protein
MVFLGGFGVFSDHTIEIIEGILGFLGSLVAIKGAKEHFSNDIHIKTNKLNITVK